YLQGNEIARTYHIYSPGQVIEIQCQTPGASTGASDNVITTRKTYGIQGFDGLGESVLAPDGSLQISKRQAPRDGVWLTNVVLSGQPDGSGSGIADGTQTTTIINPNGQTFSVETVAIPSAVTAFRETYGYSDNYTSPTRVINL